MEQFPEEVSCRSHLRKVREKQGVVWKKCSDKSTSYVNISDYVEIPIMEKTGKETTATTLQSVHIAIANAKRTLLGIYHKIKGKYFQNYLDEFCYKLNMRYYGQKLFHRLAIAITTHYWYING